MLNNEEVLIKVMELLDLNIKEVKLKAPIQKKRFINKDTQVEKYDEHLKLIFEELSLNSINSKLLDVIYELMYIYDITVRELSRFDNIKKDKKLDWIILKRLVIPFLAYRMAILDGDYNNRIDKNMSGGKFWYLPDLTNKNKIEMPVSNLIKWWLSLYGKGLEAFSEEMDKKISYEFHSTKKPLNIFKSWLYQNKLPSRKSIIEYCNIKMNYNGIFTGSTTDFIHENFTKAVSFVKDIKKLTQEELIHEIPEKKLIDKIYIDESNIFLKHKKKFIKLVKERWDMPSESKLISNFLICRFSQNLYSRLVGFFGFDETHDIQENKILQLIHLYMFLYNQYIEGINKELIIDEEENSSIFIDDKNIRKYLKTRKEDYIQAIIGDIRLEHENPDEKDIKYADIDIVLISLFAAEKDTSKLKKTVDNYKRTVQYFYENHKRWNKNRNYQKLDINTFNNEIHKEDNFTLLHELFDNFINTDYSRSQMICSRMNCIAKTNDEDKIHMSSKLTLNTALTYLQNENSFIETKELLDNYESYLVDHKLLETNNKKLLSQKASFYFKSKEFSESLNYFDKYVEEYLIGNKKDDFDLSMVYFAAYCANKVNDKLKYNKFNKILIRHQWPEFSPSSNFIFKKCFYK